MTGIRRGSHGSSTGRDRCVVGERRQQLHDRLRARAPAALGADRDGVRAGADRVAMMIALWSFIHVVIAPALTMPATHPGRNAGACPVSILRSGSSAVPASPPTGAGGRAR